MCTIRTCTTPRCTNRYAPPTMLNKQVSLHSTLSTQGKVRLVLVVCDMIKARILLVREAGAAAPPRRQTNKVKPRYQSHIQVTERNVVSTTTTQRDPPTTPANVDCSLARPPRSGGLTIYCRRRQHSSCRRSLRCAANDKSTVVGTPSSPLNSPIVSSRTLLLASLYSISLYLSSLSLSSCRLHTSQNQKPALFRSRLST